MVKMVPPAHGFAVIMAGEIVVNTVSATARAAKVNGLVILFGMKVLDVHTDEQIAVAWDKIERRVPGVMVGPVLVGWTA